MLEHEDSPFFPPTAPSAPALHKELYMKMRMNNFALAVLVCVVISCQKESTTLPDIAEQKNSIEVEQELMDTVNEHRISLGINALNFNSVAYGHANTHTDYMISAGSTSHDNFTYRASEISAATDAEFVAENVARDYVSASEAFQGWLNSTNHKNTMEGDFTHTAISVKEAANGKLYFTQIFYR